MLHRRDLHELHASTICVRSGALVDEGLWLLQLPRLQVLSDPKSLQVEICGQLKDSWLAQSDLKCTYLVATRQILGGVVKVGLIIGYNFRQVNPPASLVAN